MLLDGPGRRRGTAGQVPPHRPPVHGDASAQVLGDAVPRGPLADPVVVPDRVPHGPAAVRPPLVGPARAVLPPEVDEAVGRRAAAGGAVGGGLGAPHPGDGERVLRRPAGAVRRARRPAEGDCERGQHRKAPSSLAALAASPVVPYAVRSLSLDVLTALVARRDPSGTLSLLARQNNVLAELGVGKGQYLGLLPALIRYSLASLNSFLLSGGPEGNDDNGEADAGRLKSEEGTDGNDDGGLALKSGEEEKKEETKRDVGLELGLAFLRATRPRSPPRGEAEELALEFVDSILTLTSAVISVPTGTASLTDCGLIPALVSTVALSGRPDPFGGTGSSYVGGLLRYVAAQAVTILEGAMVTHGNALSAFHELSGVDVLVKRIDVEMKRMRPSPPTGGETDAGAAGESEPRRPLTADASSRILLFSAANCLTVAYHHSEAPAAASAAPSAGELIRRPEMEGLLREVFGNMPEYGGALGSLLCTFVSHLMNQDPQIVHWAHRSGLASCFLGMFAARGAFGDDIASWDEPRLGPNTDLITSVPNVVAALSLTESGARSVREADPFSPLLAVFASRKYAMPNSRCLLSEMAAIVGTGLDEIMRHTPSLSETVMKAVVRVIRRVVYLGKKLAAKETDEDSQGGGARGRGRTSCSMVSLQSNVF
ncbi:hypothetical protein THAOC_01644 [Thalassiosira oceanica]|uniref:DUF913 domain-containing protein n=1 Tax=Thalassiosira oceanica TaxID=159749 RepID=K0TQT1_THAOC|nr:hypothetical protein THAOC_01644 [Thalassiosira oceanica]|eukprot:EJK76587.1 hypothetical protein THAOC_01644 [Thalassiosira oceanica]